MAKSGTKAVVAAAAWVAIKEVIKKYRGGKQVVLGFKRATQFSAAKC